MKRHFPLIFLLVCVITISFAKSGVAFAQEGSATPDATLSLQTDTPTTDPVGITPSATPSQELPTSTPIPPQPTATSAPVGRPQIVVAEYHSSQAKVHAGSDFDLEISFRNDGTQPAYGLSIVFGAESFYVRETGGVWSKSELAPGESFTIRQPLTASWSLAGYTMATSQISASYTDGSGATYSDTYSISIDIYFSSTWGNPTPTPTPTPALGESPQVIVQAYQVDVDPLKPGVNFSLQLTLVNLGSQLAKGTRMSIGTGVQSSGSAAAGSAPFVVLDSSNLIYVGNIQPGETRSLTLRMMVDVKAAAGIYLLPLTFGYSSEKGQDYTESQQVTLTIRTTPQLKISFYEPPEDLQVGIAGFLPLQVTNMGYQTVLLGDLHLTANQGVLGSDTVSIGPLESGGSFTHDAEIIPDASGELDLHITVEYVDLFGDPQNMAQTLVVQVNDAFQADGGTTELQSDPDIPVAPQSDSFLQKLWSFIRGLFGVGG
jgi:hypothetical protein